VTADAPVVAHVIRNGFIESRHHGHVVALSHDGRVALSAGVVDEPMFPRSAAKPLQALAMLRLGWQPDDFEELALASASHSGEFMHVAVVERILADAGLDESALDNTPDWPLNADESKRRDKPDRLRQNCSGKHAAMLATCVANKWPITAYLDADHPLQVGIREVIEQLAGEHVAVTAVDGCGAPLFALTLTGLARAVSAIADGAVADAMRKYPYLVGGAGRDVTAVMRAVPGMVAKDGAEGVYAAALPDGRAVAIKIEDGAARARVPVLVSALAQVGIASDELAELAVVPILGHGQPVGAVQAVSL
jgi:L-asparaginase II